MSPIILQHSIVEKVTAQRKVISKLKSEADEKPKQAKTDVEAMIFGTKPGPEGIRQMDKRHEYR